MLIIYPRYILDKEAFNWCFHHSDYVKILLLCWAFTLLLLSTWHVITWESDFRIAILTSIDFSFLRARRKASNFATLLVLWKNQFGCIQGLHLRRSNKNNCCPYFEGTLGPLTIYCLDSYVMCGWIFLWSWCPISNEFCKCLRLCRWAVYKVNEKFIKLSNPFSNLPMASLFLIISFNGWDEGTIILYDWK